MTRWVLQAGLATFVAVQPAAFNPAGIPPIPPDMGRVELYLVTRGAGQEIYTKYGHTLVRVVDHTTGQDLVYDWGRFSFEEPNFVLKFLRGILPYSLGISPFALALEESRLEQRSLVQERIRLTPQQKLRLLTRLHHQSQPENREYPYRFFYDNCSTRVRDLLDDALGGKIRERFAAEPIRQTYRDQVMAYNASLPFESLVQDVILNSEADARLTKWDEMFIPLKLRDHLLGLAAYNDDGTERPDEKLLGPTETFLSYAAPQPAAVGGFMLSWILVGVPLLAGLAISRWGGRPHAGARLVGVACVCWAVVTGAVGAFLAWAWAFSDHTVLPHNANLWLFWPIDWIFLAPALRLVARGARPARDTIAVRVIRRLTWTHVGTAAAFMAVGLSGGLAQDVTNVARYLAPLSILVLGSGALMRARTRGTGRGARAERPD